jgi:hypothetical protein
MLQLVLVEGAVPGLEGHEVVAGSRAGLGGAGELELVADGRDEVDLDVHLVGLAPLLDDLLQHVVGAGHPVVPEAHGELGLGPRDVREPHDRDRRRPGGGGLEELSTSPLLHLQSSSEG